MPSTVNMLFQHHGEAPGSQLLRAFQLADLPMLVCHSSLMVQTVNMPSSLAILPQPGVGDCPRPQQAACDTSAVFSQTPTYTIGDADHGSKLHHHSYKEHPLPTLSDTFLGVSQARGASSTPNITSRGGAPATLHRVGAWPSNYRSKAPV